MIYHLNKMIHQIKQKNEDLLSSTTFTVTYELVFALRILPGETSNIYSRLNIT